MPDPLLYSVGWFARKVAGKAGGLPLALTLGLKGFVDDAATEQLDQTRRIEQCDHIKDCYSAGWSGERINAMQLAAGGKVAWCAAHNHRWYYHDQPDFKPLSAIEVLHMTPAGWTSTASVHYHGRGCGQCIARAEAQVRRGN